MSLSIIIPVYNEAEQLNYTLKKLSFLKKKIKNYEIIFIDDFSTDNTKKIIKNFSNKNSFIKIFKNKKKGLGSAIEEGILRSRLEYVCIYMCDLSDDLKDLLKYYKIINQKKKRCNFWNKIFKKFKGNKLSNFKIVIK